MAEITSGQVMPATAIETLNDSNGKPLKFKETGNSTMVAEGSDGLIYTSQSQPQVATITTTKKRETHEIPKINDPYYIRMEANRPKAGNAETTEEREKAASGKVAKRDDVQVSTSTSTSTSTAKLDKNK